MTITAGQRHSSQGRPGLSPAAPVRSAGVLYRAVAHESFRLGKHLPAPEIAPFVEYYWTIHWDLPDGRSHRQWVIPHPTVHLVFDPAGSALYGVMRGRYSRLLSGTGHVLGVRFRPAGVRPFLTGPVSALTDRVLPVAESFGPVADQQARAVLDVAESSALVAAADEFLRPRLPEKDPMTPVVAEMVRSIVEDPGMVRVDAVAERFDIGVRTLQRLFAEYVGVPPKWVLLRSRVHEAVERAGDGDIVNWARLACDLGYSDQAHLTRDFTRAVGQSPARYARDCRSGE
ncbi:MULTISPECIES: helix-turn-helix domain-containing protein [Actinoalloteichus]|uniref:DNA-binding domain-containing protein, AraC-type n=1 Tax=Actinoalloteichus fjordicus TaxID=1612552 RepID=A0AAC9LG90_9PSEU|nr:MULTISPECIES: AraC family transcriptional regulator [Actinoalloteichus]APU16796.1 DNA-binding domain-containing protein, AraC-type [Actinoalloteichus fjordicus]APU22861.1 DNA-binding domain-containing protein, AraC-type [Actinoalloteichus sp. GBA129-24]